jgi:hypothetical protein
MMLPTGLLEVEGPGEPSLPAIRALTRLHTLVSEMPVISLNIKLDSGRYAQITPDLRHL